MPLPNHPSTPLTPPTDSGPPRTPPPELQIPSFHVILDAQINAFCLPGGIIVVYEGEWLGRPSLVMLPLRPQAEWSCRAAEEAARRAAVEGDPLSGARTNVRARPRGRPRPRTPPGTSALPITPRDPRLGWSLRCPLRCCLPRPDPAPVARNVSVFCSLCQAERLGPMGVLNALVVFLGSSSPLLGPLFSAVAMLPLGRAREFEADEIGVLEPGSGCWQRCGVYRV
jgi:hypothetical protein